MKNASSLLRFLAVCAMGVMAAPALPSAQARTMSLELLIAPTGEVAGDAFGISVAGAGDVNGDGYADVIVGAVNNDAAGLTAGRAYVYFGGPGADVGADLTFTGDTADDRFGRSVAGAGDVNGDGFADLIVGAWRNDAGGSNAGRAYVYFGGPAADATADLTLTGEAADDYFGRSVAGAGDVNGDGFADLIVGAYRNDGAGDRAGRAYVYFGGPGADATADLTFSGEAAEDEFGESVAGAGDVNGDGFDDLIVGARTNDAGGNSAGRAYVYFGGPGADGTADLTLTGEAAGDYFGRSVAGAGDVNGDGYADVIVGAYFNDAAGISAGRAYVYFGGPGADAIADLTLTGEAGMDFFGGSVAGAGDVDGDGFADLIVSASGNDALGSDAGRAYVYFGGPGPDATADLIFSGEWAGDGFGTSVAGAGDVNGDGFADLIVGAYFNDAGGDNAGRAYVYGLVRPTIQANLDIRPGSCPNPLNRKSHGVLPVALLGTADLAVNDVDVPSLLLEGVAPIRWDHEDVATPFGGDPCGCTEAGPDGYLDLTLKFDTQEIVTALGPPLRDRVTLTLTGTLFDGTPFEARDCIIGVGRAEPDPIPNVLLLVVEDDIRATFQRVEYTIPTAADVTLIVYDVAGRPVKRLVQSAYPAGRHRVSWDTGGLSQGVYFYRLRAGGQEATAKLVLVH